MSIPWADLGITATVIAAVLLAWWIIRDSNKIQTPTEIRRLEQQKREIPRPPSGRTNRTGSPINRRHTPRNDAA
jgi:hypothetical protein